jgi:predicted nucleotidyltransferase
MLTCFRKFVGFKILEYFLRYPSEKTYLKELAKKLQISPRSVKIYCDLFEKEGLIKREIIGNMHIFTTNNDNFRVREMKRAYFLNLLGEMNIENIAKDCASIAVYGSYASGNYDDKSDIDILIIGNKKNVKRELVVNIMKKIDKEIQLNVIPIIKWEKMKKDKDHFVKNIIRNHVLIKGVEL